MKFQNLDKLMVPFWDNTTMVQESVLFRGEADGTVLPASLLYPANAILSVQSATLEAAFQEGKDYTLLGGKLARTCNSAIPCMRYRDMYPELPLEGHSFDKTGGGNLYFSEGDEFHSRQVAVTYTHDAAWGGPIPKNKQTLLPGFQRVLRDSNRTPNVLVMGDSITCGANSSGPIGVPPFLGSWWQLVIAHLEQKHSREVAYKNVSMGGQVSAWGVENAPEAVSSFAPDLAVIAFGMNDGTHKTPARKFQRNMRAIMEIVSQNHPKSEFVLVASILPNPEAAYFIGCQEENRQALLELEGPGVAVADVTEMHREFLQHKPYRDLTGNNVNHLNDFTARLQAQVVLQALGEL